MAGISSVWAFEIVAGAAIVAEAHGFEVDLVQLGQGGVEVVVDGGALGGLKAGQRGVAEDAAFQIVHHIEGGADHLGVFTKCTHDRDGDVAVERLHDAVLAVDLVGAGEQLARWLLAQDIEVAIAGGQQERRVGGPALKLLDAQGPLIAVDIGGHPGGQTRLVKPVGGDNVADRKISHGRMLTVSEAGSTVSQRKVVGCLSQRVSMPTGSG